LPQPIYDLLKVRSFSTHACIQKRGLAGLVWDGQMYSFNRVFLQGRFDGSDFVVFLIKIAGIICRSQLADRSRFGSHAGGIGTSLSGVKLVSIVMGVPSTELLEQICRTCHEGWPE
jgi:hypothetical protein